MAQFVRVALVSEIPEGTGKAVVANGRRVAIFNVAGAFHAVDGVCPHQGGPLGEGILDGPIVSCPWHFWQFDVVKGHAPDFPEASIPKFRVKVSGTELFVEV
ncbi:MAG TPA: Rieske 2Fe-2S domain-containing protein [Patescibacteria group bacterium]|nr:Rieske 2Fe-2S domain-containing protein [Patescibacteria group bacterium]